MPDTPFAYCVLRVVPDVERAEFLNAGVVLFWDVAGAEAGGFVRAIRADLSQLDAAAFLERWSQIEGPARS